MATIYQPFTSRENEIAHLLAQGRSQPEIAQALQIKLSSLNARVSGLKRKTFCDDTISLIVYLYRKGYGQQQ